MFIICLSSVNAVFINNWNVNDGLVPSGLYIQTGSGSVTKDYNYTTSPAPLEGAASIYVTASGEGETLAGLNTSSLDYNGDYTIAGMIHSLGSTTSNDFGWFMDGAACETRNGGVFAIYDASNNRQNFGTFAINTDYYMVVNFWNSNNTVKCDIYSGQLDSTGSPTYTSTKTVTRAGSQDYLEHGAGIIAAIGSANAIADDISLCSGISDDCLIVEGKPSPTITQNTYNVTNAYFNLTAWVLNLLSQPYTKDDTPTVTFDTDINANCSIGLNDFNFTTMIADDATTECATGGDTSQTCTLSESQKLSAGDNCMYISCIRADGLNESYASTSTCLNISMDYEFKGTFKYSNSTPIEGGFVTIKNEVTNLTLGNATTNSTGDWRGIFGRPPGPFSADIMKLNLSENNLVFGHIPLP